jgi:hypothetical protein
VNWPLKDPPPIEQVEEENSEGGAAVIVQVIVAVLNPEPVTTTTVPIGPERALKFIAGAAETGATKYTDKKILERRTTTKERERALGANNSEARRALFRGLAYLTLHSWTIST